MVRRVAAVEGRALARTVGGAERRRLDLRTLIKTTNEKLPAIIRSRFLSVLCKR